MAYVEEACADCGIILPVNEMEKVSDRVKTGESVTPIEHRERISAHVTSTRWENRKTSHYSYNNGYICRPCAKARFQRTVFMVIAVIIGLAGLYLYGVINRDAPTTDLSSNDNVMSLAGESVSNTTFIAPEPSQAVEEEPEAEAPPDEDEIAASDLPTEPALPAGDPAGDAIGAATVRALESGKAEKWSAAGATGYVVVSASQAYGSKICRNVSATIIRGQDQTKSDAHLWCKEDQGRWLAE